VYPQQLRSPNFSVDGLPVGTHKFELRHYPSYTLLASTTAALTSGQQASLAFDVTGAVGFVSGVLKVNGVVPPAYAYFICASNQACAYVSDPTGAFGFFDFPGARTATVRGTSTNLDISSFGYSVSAGLTTLVGTTSGGASGNTSSGANVTVKPIDSNTGTQTVTLTFGTVTGNGQTTVSQGHNGPNPPKGQKGGNPTWYYYIATSATFTGNVLVCINYDPTDFTNPSKLALQHYNETITPNAWEDATTSNDTNAGVLCGTVTSFSPFMITEPANDPPIAVASANSTNLGEGQTVTFDGSQSHDPNGDALLYAWDFGDGGHASSATASHAYADNGTYTAKLTVTENGAESLTSSASVTVTVVNVAPTGRFAAPTSVLEGSSFSLALTNVSDPSATDTEAGLTIEYDCGAGFGPSANCGVAADGPASRTVRARVSDKDHGSTTYTASVSVLNVNPIVSAPSTATITSGATFQFAGSFSDAGVGDGPWTTTIDWNDGPTTSAQVSAQGSVTGSHRYTAPGTYAVRLTVTDKDGGAASQTTTLVVQAVSVAVDIQPGKAPNTLSVKKPGSTLPVAILSTANFDATSVDPATITLGNESGVDTPVARSSTGTLVVNAPFDMNGDGRPDLVVHFYVADLQANGDLSMTVGTTQTMILRGKTKSPDSRSVRGTDQIAITP
jgi:PKD repeat protein